MTVRPIEIHVGQNGAKSSVAVDGVDLSRMCRGLRLESSVGKVSTLHLELATVAPTEGQVTGEAVVRWHCPAPIADALDAAHRMAEDASEDNRAALLAALEAFFYMPWGL